MPTLVTVVAVVPAMTVMAAMVAMIMMAVMEQRIEGEEGSDRRHVIVTVIRVGRRAGKRQHDQTAGRHDA
jgi:hypothetical protein